MASKKHKPASLLPLPSLLITESRDQFEDMRRALNGTIQPIDVVEEILTRDIANLSWEVFRLWGWKTAVVNKRFVSALETCFTEIFEREQEDYLEANEQARLIAHQWFANPEVKEKGLKILRRSKLDESAIEAEAFSQAGPQIESLDRLLASAESRRNKTVRILAEYRSGLGKRLESNKVLIDAEALATDDAAGANSATA